MKHLIFINLFCMIGLIFSCQSNNNTVTHEKQKEMTPQNTPKEKEQASGVNCFESVNNTHNKGSLELTIMGKKATGFLTLQNTNPEAAHTGMGGFAGTIENDIIFANYAFMIEGDHQTQEVSFKMKDGKLFQGIGAFEETDGILTFKDKDHINYSVEFQKVDCQKIAEPISWAKDIANR